MMLVLSYTAVYNCKSRTVFYYTLLYIVLFRNGRATNLQNITCVLLNRELSTGIGVTYVNPNYHNSVSTPRELG
jgi:hypothetical protein